jgi:ABC-type lipoprotein export system ATPase subunit
MGERQGTDRDADGPVVEASGIFHVYRERDIETVALRGADLTVDAGAWISIMGPSGSGKSTLLHILAGLLKPTAGAVRLAGEDLTRLPPDECARRRRDRIGVVLQRDNLHPLLDVAENVALGPRLSGRRRAEVRDRVDALLAGMGLAAQRRQRSTRLSGGESQRVAVAAAMALRPVVLLADEPTGELDGTTAEVVLDLIDGLRAECGTAVVTVTHNPAVAERAGQRLTMRDGQVVDAG